MLLNLAVAGSSLLLYSTRKVPRIIQLHLPKKGGNKEKEKRKRKGSNSEYQTGITRKRDFRCVLRRNPKLYGADPLPPLVGQRG